MKTLNFILLFKLFWISMGLAKSAPPLLDVQYGEEAAQLLDLYLPSEGDGSVSKVFLLLHGGAWISGEKSHMGEYVRRLQLDFPTHAIATIDYRLATYTSPGYPKQVDDVSQAVSFLKSTFTGDVTFCLLGTSAGAHLAMLYTYSSNDTAVKAVVSHVGPTDFTDPVYTTNIIYNPFLYNLFGPCSYAQFPGIWSASSPLTYLSATSPPTIGFYGDVDLVVPTTQMPRLRDRFENLGIRHEFSFYSGGHTGWPEESCYEMMSKVKEFLDEVW